MQQYRDLLRQILENKIAKEHRADKNVWSVFGVNMRFDLSEGFPWYPIKAMNFDRIVHTTLWRLSGDTRIGYLKKQGIHDYDTLIDPDTAIYEKEKLIDGNLGPIENLQWRYWPRPVTGDEIRIAIRDLEPHQVAFVVGGLFGEHSKKAIDQLKNACTQLLTEPDSHFPIVSAWNVGNLDAMTEAPRVPMFQFRSSRLSLGERLQEAINHGYEHEYREEVKVILDGGVHDGYEYNRRIEAWCRERNIPSRRLCCHVYQQSGDAIHEVLEVIAQHALIVMMMAHVLQMKPGYLTWTGGDCYIQEDDLSFADQLLELAILPKPTLSITTQARGLFNFMASDFKLQ